MVVDHLVWLLFIAASALACARNRFDVRNFGGIGDGKTMNTAAFKKAIAEAAVNGGTVFATDGVYLSGTIQLLSHVCLEVDASASILGTTITSEYLSVVSIEFDSGAFSYPLIYSVNTSGTGLLGAGAINGGANDPPGHLVDHYDPVTNYLFPVSLNFSGGPARAKLVLFRQCTDVVIQDIHLMNSPFWTLSLERSSGIAIRNASITGDRRWPNNDGMDIIGSSNITIEDTHIATGDDCICLVSHTPDPIRNVLVRNTHLQSTSAAVKLTTFDVDAAGDIEHITFEDITITDSNRGLAVMPRWGTASIRHVLFYNITIETKYFTSPWWGAAEPLYITLLNFTTDRLCSGTIANITFSNIRAQSENGIVLMSSGPLIAGVTLRNITLTLGSWGNLSLPCRDYRPTTDPQVLPAAIDGLFGQALQGLTLETMAVVYAPPCLATYGVCSNLTNTPGLVQRGVQCHPCHGLDTKSSAPPGSEVWREAS